MSSASTPHEKAIVRLAEIASAHARDVISNDEAADLYDTIAEALHGIFPEGEQLARQSAVLLRESERCQLRFQKLVSHQEEDDTL